MFHIAFVKVAKHAIALRLHVDFWRLRFFSSNIDVSLKGVLDVQIFDVSNNR